MREERGYEGWGLLLNNFGPGESHATSTHIIQQKETTGKQAKLRDVPAGQSLPLSGSVLRKRSVSLWCLVVCPYGEWGSGKQDTLAALQELMS